MTFFGRKIILQLLDEESGLGIGLRDDETKRGNGKKIRQTRSASPREGVAIDMPIAAASETSL